MKIRITVVVTDEKTVHLVLDQANELAGYILAHLPSLYHVQSMDAYPAIYTKDAATAQVVIICDDK